MRGKAEGGGRRAEGGREPATGSEGTTPAAEGQSSANGGISEPPNFHLPPSASRLSQTHHWLREGTGPFRRADVIPATDRGFRYGMAVFETLRVQGGEVEWLGEHLWRLGRACRTSGFPVPGGVLRDAARLLREVAGADRGWTGVARLHVTAGDGGPADPPRGCRVLVSLEPRLPPPVSPIHAGLHLRVHPTPHHPPFGGRKTHNYWGNADALQAARRAGADEALLSDPEGRLISACMANVFLLRDGELFTPPVSRGARAGVLRARVLRLTGAGVRDLFPAEWQAPGTGFLVTNSWLRAVPGFVVGAEPEGADRDALAAVVRRVHGERKG